MSLGKRKVSEYKTQLVSQRFPRSFSNRICHSAIRALVISVLDERNRSVIRPGDMIAITHGWRQLSVAHCRISAESDWKDSAAVERAVSFSRAFRIPSAPGFTSTGER